MFEKDQPIYYISKTLDVLKGIYKGFGNVGCRYSEVAHITDIESGENILINQDYVFDSEDEAIDNIISTI